MAQTHVGIDVAKHHLDLAVRGAAHGDHLPHDQEGIEALCHRLTALAPNRIVVEATGGREVLLVTSLQAAGLPMAVVHPRRARAFGRASGQLAKADRIDARLLTRMAAVLQPPVRPLPDADLRALRAVVVRRRQVVAMCAQEKTHLDTTPAAMRPHIQAHLDWLQTGLERLNRELQDRLQNHPPWSGPTELLRRVPGVGPVVAAVRVAELPELEPRGSHQLAALVGVAPLNRDSGQLRGQRRVWGGRASVRRILYMATLTTICHDPPIRAFYTRLCAQGKPRKVALVAAMRKLLTVLNAVSRDQVPWQTEPLPTALPSHPTPQIP